MRGFSAANLRAMRRVYMEYGRDPIIQQLAEELEMKRGAAVLEQAEEAVLSWCQALTIDKIGITG
jgi:hypothetical protein